jgi:hypothetical protein
MKENGLSSIYDVLMFALLLSVATFLMSEFTPIDPEIKNEAYASGLARSTLLAFQGATVDGVGGVEYEVGGPSFSSAAGGSTKRVLKYKTFAELLAEDAFLNRAGTRLDLEGELERVLKRLLDRIFGGRYGYRLRARVTPTDPGPDRQGFEISVEDLGGASRMLCSKTLLLPLPTFSDSLQANTEHGLETGPPLRVTLEVWSR